MYIDKMNISFDVKNVQSSNKPDDTIKKEINYFKLHVEKDSRYISDFEIFPDDNCIMCYTEDNEIELINRFYRPANFSSI